MGHMMVIRGTCSALGSIAIRTDHWRTSRYVTATRTKDRSSELDFFVLLCKHQEREREREKKKKNKKTKKERESASIETLPN